MLLKPLVVKLVGGDCTGDERRADRERQLTVEVRDPVGENLARVCGYIAIGERHASRLSRQAVALGSWG
jgi:hypothetical protein